MTSLIPQRGPNMLDASPGDVVEPWAPFDLVGSAGLRRNSGYVDEEYLPKLRGRQAMKMYREIGDNSPMIGGWYYALTQLVRQIEWDIEPAGKDRTSAQAAKFLEQNMHDMEHSWKDGVLDFCSFAKYGWQLSEMLFKQRRGIWASNERDVSKFSDGMIGFRSIEGRSQDSMLRWVFGPNDEVLAMVQQAPPRYQLKVVPLSKCLHFRTTKEKNNPEGRALALDTPIPTPDGWRTMADLQTGDPVFDETGRIRYVTGTATWSDRPAYRVRFADGTSIVADAAHEWLANTGQRRFRGQPAKLVSTEQIATSMSFTSANRLSGIEWAAPVEMPRQNLLIDPWTLGLWLGDGASASANIACHADDLAETVSLIESAGYLTKPQERVADNGGTIRVYGMQALLGVLDVQGAKHIPEQYLRGSKDQRLALLQGLMDSDGTVDAAGRCEFTNVNRGLVEGVAELVRSLGMSAHFSLRRRATETTQTSWCVKFTPERFVPFRLARKAARCISTRSRNRHYIVAVEAVEAQTTKCIEVDSPSHLFLAGEAYVPTHNSFLRNVYEPWYYLKRHQEIEAVGVSRDLAGMPMAKVPPKLFDPNGPLKDKAMLDAIKRLVTNIYRNEHDGIVWPWDPDEHGNSEYDFELISSSGTRQFDTESIINRYKTEMLQALLCDFLMVGHENTGSYNMHTDKTGLWRTAINSIAETIADEFNRKAVKTLFRLNNWRLPDLPKIKPHPVDPPDLTQLSTFLQAMQALGMQVLPDPTMEKFLRDAAGLPEMSPEQEQAAAAGQQQSTILQLANQHLQAIQMDQQAMQGQLELEQGTQGAAQGVAALSAGPGDQPDPNEQATGAARAQSAQTSADVDGQRGKLAVQTDKVKLAQEKAKLQQLKRRPSGNRPGSGRSGAGSSGNRRTPVRKAFYVSPYRSERILEVHR